MMFCPKCGCNMDNEAKFCRECGSSLSQDKTVKAPSAEPADDEQQSTQYAEVQADNRVQSTQPVEQKVQYTQTSYEQPLSKAAALDKPLSVWQYLGIFLVSIIPIVGIVFTFIWAFGSSVNTNKKNYCRAVLIMALIGIVLSIVLSMVFGALIRTLFDFSYSIPLE